MDDLLKKMGVKEAYAGEASTKFWDIINALPDEQQSTAYSLGCALQNVEGDIRNLINVEIFDTPTEREMMPHDFNTIKANLDACLKDVPITDELKEAKKTNELLSTLLDEFRKFELCYLKMKLDELGMLEETMKEK